MFAAFISFDDGRCRRLRTTQEPTQVEEAILACDATQTEANLLDESLNVVARVKREPAAINGYVVIKAS